MLEIREKGKEWGEQEGNRREGENTYIINMRGISEKSSGVCPGHRLPLTNPDFLESLHPSNDAIHWTSSFQYTRCQGPVEGAEYLLDLLVDTYKKTFRDFCFLDKARDKAV